MTGIRFTIYEESSQNTTCACPGLVQLVATIDTVLLTVSCPLPRKMTATGDFG